MTEDEAKAALIALWLEKADDALASAELVLGAGHLNFALSRLYYACFYAVTALLQSDGKQFKRHSGVRSALGQFYIKTGRIEKSWAKFYNKLFDNRLEGDYLADKTFEADDISERLGLAREFVRIVRGLIPSD